MALNLSLGFAFLFGGFADGLAGRLGRAMGPGGMEDPLAISLYLAAVFAIHAIWNLPLDFWCGYVADRRFGLAKAGMRAYLHDWLIGMAQQGAMFLVGAWLIMAARLAAGEAWWAAICLATLGLFLMTTWLAVDLLPVGLYQFQLPEPDLEERLRLLAGGLRHRVPRLLLFTAPEQRGYSGGVLGLGRRTTILISRSTVELASEALLKFIVIRGAGRRVLRHGLWAAVVAWLVSSLGIIACGTAAARLWGSPAGSPRFIDELAVLFSAWMVAVQPLVAWFGRRVELAADRFYLDNGGGVDELRMVLEEVSRRNLVQARQVPRLILWFRSMPAIADRLAAARRHVAARRGVR